MAFGTYAELQAAICKWAWREDDESFAASVPDFIALAEARINRELRVGAMETTAPIVMTGGVGTLPADYLQFRTVSLNGGGWPRYINSSAVAGYGDQFAIDGSTIRLGYGATGDVSLVYYARIPALSDANPTNWLLAKAPDLYLYGSLVESAPFMMDDARLGTWTTLYQKAMQDLINDDNRAKYARASTRSSVPMP